MSKSDGSTADYYVLPEGATQLQDLISHRNMNAQIGEITRACYRYGMASHSDMLRDAKKIRFYAQAEVERLEKLAASEQCGQLEALSGVKFGDTPIEQVKPEDCVVVDPNMPSWDDAPEGMKWLAQDGAFPFAWVFFENEPFEKQGAWIQNEGKWLNKGPGKEPLDHLKTLQPRPTSTAK